MKKKIAKGFSRSSAQQKENARRQKIIKTLKKSGMDAEQINYTLENYTIKRRLVYKNGKKLKQTILLPKTENSDSGSEALYISLP